MESLAQELLEAIIDYVPPDHASSCSLVARRWRKRSQQRHFMEIALSCERRLDRWCAIIPQDPNGIPSYVQDIEISITKCWLGPTLLSHIFKCLSRLKTLTIYRDMVPHDIIVSGEFGRELTSITLISSSSTVSTLMQSLRLLPNLRELTFNSNAPSMFATLGPPDKTWQQKPLQSLKLSWLWSKEIEFIAQCGVTSRRINVSARSISIEKVIACSSETMDELVLRDAYPSFAPGDPHYPVVPLPPLLALVTMEVDIHLGSLSDRLADFLSCIRSAPALSSITFKYVKRFPVEDIPASGPWISVDKWLARLATDVRTKRSLTVVLTPWLEGNSQLEEWLPEFRKAGGELKVEKLVFAASTV